MGIDVQVESGACITTFPAAREMPAALIQVAPGDAHVDEVETYILGVATKEDVVGLDVSMDPTVAVKTLQMIQDLDGNLAYTRDL